MLKKMSEIEDYNIHAIDGDMGKLHDIYFDDSEWSIRYFIINTGNWLIDRLVLISPASVTEINHEKREINFGLSKKEIENSPIISKDKPVSLQAELELTKHYGWPVYWSGIGIGSTTGVSALPYLYADKDFAPGERTKDHDNYDPHLRSYREVKRYDIQTAEGNIGHVVDFIIDTNEWKIYYMIVNTRNWLPGGKDVLIHSMWIKKISYPEQSVEVMLGKEEINNCPEYDPESFVSRDYEEKLFEHYEREKYWEVK